MSEVREYISQVEEQGRIRISEEVIATIAALSTVEVEGVASLAAHHGADIAEQLNKKNIARGVRLQLTEDAVAVDVAVLVKYGYAIPDVAKAVQEAVKSNIEATAGLAVKCVNVHIFGISFAKEAK